MGQEQKGYRVDQKWLYGGECKQKVFHGHANQIACREMKNKVKNNSQTVYMQITGKNAPNQISHNVNPNIRVDAFNATRCIQNRYENVWS